MNEPEDFRAAGRCWQCGKDDPMSDHRPTDRYAHSALWHLRCAGLLAYVDLHRDDYAEIDLTSLRTVRDFLALDPTSDGRAAAAEVKRWVIEREMAL